MLKIHKISYRYANHPWLFRDINLEIKPGEVVGLYGKSGIGKTTLAKIIGDYLTPIEGGITVDGESYPIPGRQPVQLMWQHPEKAVNPRWRMRKILYEGGDIDSTLMAQMGIREEWFRRYPSQLSGGELQRFCLARALGTDTRYLIADEMTTMLDALTQVQIWQVVLEKVRKRQIGVLAISHEQALLKRISHRILDFDEMIKVF